ncbi:ATP-binding protein [Micromonospora sp. RB23]
MTTPLPRPGRVRTAAEFVARLRALKAWSGLSYRSLEREGRKQGCQLPPSTVATALNRSSLPNQELVAAIVRACRCAPSVVDEWLEAQRVLAVAEETTPDVDVAAGIAARVSIAEAAQSPNTGLPAAQARPYLLPPDLSVFVGRDEEVDRACRLLTEDGPGPATLLITGPAGGGKTALAVRVGHLLTLRFPDGQLYVDLGGFNEQQATPAAVLGAFLRALGVRGGAVPANLPHRINLYRTLLAEKQVLVILDNARDAPQVRDLLPSGSRCATIVTSRTSLAELGGRRLPLSVLEPSAALALLADMLGHERIVADPASARLIVDTCGGLPLAVWVAGARLAARPHWPLRKVARALADEQRKLDELAVGHVAVRASLELTYQAMDVQSQHALRMLSLLPATDFASWSAAALLDLSLPDAEAVLDGLVDVHLVEISSVSTAGPRYRLHDLVKLLGRERAEQEDSPHECRSAATRVLSASLDLAERAADILCTDFLGIPQTGLVHWRLPGEVTDELLTDPQTWFTGERRFLISVADWGLNGTDIASAAGLITAMTSFFQIGSHFDDWERLQDRALKVALHGGDRRSAAKLHRCLGELTTILDRYPEAIEHFEQALLLAEGEGPTYRASATAGLAYVHRLLGHYPSAIRHFEAAATLARGAGNVNCLVYAMNGIGVIELENGHAERAEKRFAECLRISRLAGYRPGEAQALRCLGQSHRAHGDYRAAGDCFEQAATISAALGDRLSATHATCWLGDVLVRRGEHAEGRRLLARSLWTYREFGNLWGEAATLNALAEAQLLAGQPALARRRAEAATGLWRRIGSRTWLAVGLDTLAGALTMSGNLVAAAEVCEEAAAMRAADATDS